MGLYERMCFSTACRISWFVLFPPLAVLLGKPFPLNSSRAFLLFSHFFVEFQVFRGKTVNKLAALCRFHHTFFETCTQSGVLVSPCLSPCALFLLTLLCNPSFFQSMSGHCTLCKWRPFLDPQRQPSTSSCMSSHTVRISVDPAADC